MEYLIGVLIGVAVAAFAQLVGFDRSRNFYPIVLIVIASYYLLFAAMGGSASALWLEALVLGAFVLVAVSGFRLSLWLVVAGLIAHGVFDAVHLSFVYNPGVPKWWPDFCLAADLAIAGYAAMRITAARPHGAS
jgi:phosphoglycerol transferase MdoB-like AlkP superfamily enzyme